MSEPKRNEQHPNWCLWCRDVCEAHEHLVKCPIRERGRLAEQVRELEAKLADVNERARILVQLTEQLQTRNRELEAFVEAVTKVAFKVWLDKAAIAHLAGALRDGGHDGVALVNAMQAAIAAERARRKNDNAGGG